MFVKETVASFVAPVVSTLIMARRKVFSLIFLRSSKSWRANSLARQSCS